MWLAGRRQHCAVCVMVFVQVGAGALSLAALARLVRKPIARAERRRIVDIMTVFDVGFWLSVLLRCGVCGGRKQGRKKGRRRSTYAQDGY